MLTDEYVDSLPDDPLLAVKQLTEQVVEEWDKLQKGEEAQKFDFFLESFALVKVLLTNTDAIGVDIPSVSGGPREVAQTIAAFCNEVHSKAQNAVVESRLAQLERKYSPKFGQGFSYEFSEGDVAKIQHLINDLRDRIASSSLFAPDHKRRLLARLEKLQSEVHKKMADLDRFWGLIGDAGVAIGKFGKEAKPFVDRIKEISDIVWRTQSRAEELPSDTPMALIDSKNIDSDI